MSHFRSITQILMHNDQLTRRSVGMTSLLSQYDSEVSLDQDMPVTLSGGDLVAARRFEVAAALSRLRGLAVD